ncbi:MAG: HemK family protein methyltransferase, partial [Paramuribaculum sp.]|nr:HemK family protein methyltransferase [Paramuribaculum sp.]
SDLNLLDIATGSGCIAIALARNLPFSHVEATDISAKALDVARANAARLRCNITFTQQDILTAKPPADPTFDIVVSNPPYVMNSEKAEMESRVIDHEPPGALFVPDDDPLKFYLAVAVYAESALKAGGRLYFELNPLTADELSSVLEKRGCWNDISIRRDSFGKKRMLRATLG